MLRIIFVFLFITIKFTFPSYSETWFTSSGNYYSSKFSNLNHINRMNIKDLNTAWMYKNGFTSYKKNFFINNQTTPIFTGNSLILTSLDNYVISVNPSNGKENWRIKISNPTGKRGLTYFKGNIFVPSYNGVYVINETTGKINVLYGKSGLIGTENDVSLVPPIVLKDKIFIAYKKFITSHDLPSGNLNWRLDLNGARVWSGISFDIETNTLAFVTSNLIKLIGNTSIENDYSNSIVLVDSLTGRTKCKFKDTIHDHWDLDMVGNPIIVNLKTNDNQLKKLIYAFSKTGNTFVVDIEECDLFNKNYIEKIFVNNNSPISDQIYSDHQIKITNPEKLMNLEYNLEDFLNYVSDDKDNFDYIKHKTRNSKFGDSYIPLSFDYDVIMFGLHGGPEWPSGTYDKNNKQIIIPTNHYPWIIRSYYGCCTRNKERAIRKFDEFIISLSEPKGYLTYNQKCKSCHGKNKNGLYESESTGERYFPGLNGVTKLKKFHSLKNVNNYIFSHKYSSPADINEDELKDLRKYLKKRDNYLIKNNLLQKRAVWQLLLDKYGNFASKPPYGKLTAFSIDTGLKNWEIPFGEKKLKNGKAIKGDMNFGGVLSTAGNILFATGTPDKKIIVFDSLTGNELWQKELEYAGSSPPMTYFYRGEQYIVVNSSGGKYYGYEEKLGDAIYAFKVFSKNSK